MVSTEQKILKLLREQNVGLEELAENLKTDAGKVAVILSRMQTSGVPIQHKQGRYHIPVLPEAGNIYRLNLGEKGVLGVGMTADWHFASKFHLPKSWHEAMDRLADAGIKNVLVAGDVVDGHKVYKGQLENIVTHSIEEQTDLVAEALSKHPELMFYGIAGNHDYSFTQLSGAKPLALIEAKVSNFRNLGDFRADIITDHLRIRMLHGASGRVYAKTYAVQTYNRDFFSGLDHEALKDAPHVMLVGHYHTGILFQDHGMWVAQPGSFQDGDNEYCIRRGLTGPTGLWAARLQHNKGILTGFAAEYIVPKASSTERGTMHARNTRRYGG